MAQKWLLKRSGLPTKSHQLFCQKTRGCFFSTADKTAFPMCSIKATGSEPLSTPLSWLAVMQPPGTSKTQVRTKTGLVAEGRSSGTCSEVTWSLSDGTNTAEWGAELQSESQTQRVRDLWPDIWAAILSIVGWGELWAQLFFRVVWSCCSMFHPRARWKAAAVTAPRQWPGLSLALCCGLLLLLALFCDLFKVLHLAH